MKRSNLLTFEERQFIDEICYKGLNKYESYCLIYGVNEESEDEINKKSEQLFKQKKVFEYYESVMKEIRDGEKGKGIWTKERSTEKLVRLIEKVEKELYDENAKLTMARLNGIILPVKELNTMNGFNQTNLNVDSNSVVQFIGEDNLLD